MTCCGETLRDLEDAVVAGGSLPLAVWIHGGAWLSGNKSRASAPEVLGPDYAVASIACRLSRQARFPAQVHDCEVAIRWLRAHAVEYGIDPDRSVGFVRRRSPGGLLGTSGGLEELEGTVGDGLGVSSRVEAVRPLRADRPSDPRRPHGRARSRNRSIARRPSSRRPER